MNETLVLFQPAAFGGGAADPVITGGVTSIFTLTETAFESPATLVAEQVMVIPGVDVESSTVLQPEDDAMPDSGSVTLQETETGLIYQPLFPNVPLTVGMMTGGVVSMTITKFAVATCGTQAETLTRQLESVTLTVTTKEPAPGGVPDSVPASGSIESHGGPEVTVHVSTPSPPAADIAAA